MNDKYYAKTFLDNKLLLKHLMVFLIGRSKFLLSRFRILSEKIINFKCYFCVCLLKIIFCGILSLPSCDEENDSSKTINDDFVNHKVNFHVELIVCQAEF